METSTPFFSCQLPRHVPQVFLEKDLSIEMVVAPAHELEDHHTD
jgi:hypothetical protein